MSFSTFLLVGSFPLIAQCCRLKGKKTESSDDANINKMTTTPSYSPILTKFQYRAGGTPKSTPIAPSKNQSPEALKTQTSKRIEEDRKTDSFAYHTPRILVSKRTSEVRASELLFSSLFKVISLCPPTNTNNRQLVKVIRSKPPVCGDRDDYKTIRLQMFPSSSDEGD
uniref:Uncharacterized protein n=1 Tax=Parascaris univalens TaxID=6257 RepID=A0A915A4Z7_PARUN